jgi:signal transduction histidine kinase
MDTKEIHTLLARENRRVERLKKEARERMQEADLKSEFMATISHELRNPLTTVKMALQSLKEGLCGPIPPQQMRFVDLAYRNVERQVRIIDNVLDLARLQSGQAKMRFRRTPLSSLIEERAQAYAIAVRKPSLEFDIPERLPDLHADPDLVTQVLSNLIDNALRYARERVTVGAEEAELSGAPGVIVSVKDDGPGLPAAEAARLFTKFGQIGRASGSGYKGTGLGLSICKEIVACHGGRIWVESSPGRGARFRFSLPAEAASSHAV